MLTYFLTIRLFSHIMTISKTRKEVFALKHKKIIALVLICVCVIGSVMFIAEHRQSATENVANDVAIEDEAEVTVDVLTSEENTEIATEQVSEADVSTESVSEEPTTESVAAETVPTADELNQIGVTVGDTYEFTY